MTIILYTKYNVTLYEYMVKVLYLQLIHWCLIHAAVWETLRGFLVHGFSHVIFLYTCVCVCAHNNDQSKQTFLPFLFPEHSEHPCTIS